ncbi:SPJ_0845 family protein [Loigolactobacillus bifermentans]|jgi:hypothetical protein|nr:SPJ_0845 family protein [Loigolactobacillus bifermentans]
MGLTFRQDNSLNELFDKFATVPKDPVDKKKDTKETDKKQSDAKNDQQA